MYKIKPFYKNPDIPLLYQDEVWKLIDIIPNIMLVYFISNYGRVYSAISNKILKPACNKQTGYLVVNLYNNDGSANVHTIHRLEMLTFCYIPGCEELLVNHKDTNKLNNYLENLEWCTYAYNTMHASLNGLLLTGEDAPWTTLSDDQVHQICNLYLQGISRNDIAEIVGCKVNRVHEILSGGSRTNISSLYGIVPKEKVYKYNQQEGSTTK